MKNQYQVEKNGDIIETLMSIYHVEAGDFIRLVRCTDESGKVDTVSRVLSVSCGVAGVSLPHLILDNGQHVADALDGHHYTKDRQLITNYIRMVAAPANATKGRSAAGGRTRPAFRRGAVVEAANCTKANIGAAHMPNLSGCPTNFLSAGQRGFVRKDDGVSDTVQVYMVAEIPREDLFATGDFKIPGKDV